MSRIAKIEIPEHIYCTFSPKLAFLCFLVPCSGIQQQFSSGSLTFFLDKLLLRMFHDAHSRNSFRSLSGDGLIFFDNL